MTTHTLDTPTSGDSHRPPMAMRFVHAFRHWRKGRPFPAGLLIILAGVELWLAPLSSIGTIIHEGVGGVSAFFIGALMVMFGLTIWVAPAYRVFAGISSILLALIALPATNLGGFFIGTLLGLIGGAFAISWVPRPGWEAPTYRERRRARAAQKQAANLYAASSVAEHAAAAPPTVAEQELAALEARTNEPEPAMPPTADLPEVENTGAAERPED
jgi:Family of unknown function (DUF6114)